MSGHTDFPTAGQVLTGKYYLTNTATPAVGTMANLGAVSINSTSTSSTAGYVSSISVDGNAVVTSAMSGHTDFPTASQVLAGKYYLTNTTTPAVGTMTDLGAVSITSTSSTSGAGYVSSITVDGNGIVASAMGAHTDFPTASQVLTGKYYLTNTATPAVGTMADLGAISINSTSTSSTAGYVSSISVDGNAVVTSAMGGHTDFPTASQVLTGKYYLTNTTTPAVGTMANLGAITVNSTSTSSTAGYVSSISVDANAVAASAMGAHTDFPTAAQVLTGKYFLTDNATPVVGTMTDHGAVSITSTSSSYTAGYVSSIGVNANSVINSALGGHTGAAAGDVFTGKYFLSTTATPTQGTMADLGAFSVTSTASTSTAGYVSSITVNPGADFLNTNICTGKTILGVGGSASCIGAAGTGTEGTAISLCSGKYLWYRTGAAVNGTRYCAPDTLSYTTGLKLWLKADDLNGNADANTGYSLGGEVSTWKDSSGSGNHVSQAGAGQKPTYNRTQGSMAVVRFDGTNDSLTRSITASDVFPNTNQVDVFVVMMQKGAQANSVVFSILLPDLTNFIDLQATFNNGIYADYGNYLTGGRWVASQPTEWDNAFHIVEMYRSGGSGEIVVDGTTLALTQGGGGLTDSADVTPTGTFIVGAESTTYLMGDIAELLIFGSALGAGDRTTVKCYLSNKYGFGLSGC